MASLDLFRLLLGAGFLAYATALDLRTRRVPNGVWIALGVLGLLLFAADSLVTHRFDWIDLVVAVGVIALAYGLWYVHLLAGGADAKALMALGVLLPQPIDWTWDHHAFPAWTSPVPGSLVVLANSLLLFALAPVALLVYNLAKRSVRFPTMFLGYQMDLDAAQRSFVWIVDRVRDDGSIRQILFPSATTEEEYNANVERLRARSVTRVWVTPKIPFMLPLLLGFVAAFTVGDILFTLVRVVVQRVQGA